ncbi:MAG: N-acetylmuramoyl-L-alanine amidase, partial [Flavisolibacter sp.]
MKHSGRFFSVALISLSALIMNCNRNPYATTNKSYKKQAKAYARLLKQAPVQDSISTGSWVGTTNFNMRKPNFVIIHH